MQTPTKYIVLIHKDEAHGYWGECPELPGCFSQGDTANELMEHMKEAIALYLNEEPLSEEELQALKEAEAEIAAGNFDTWENVKHRLAELPYENFSRVML